MAAPKSKTPRKILQIAIWDYLVRPGRKSEKPWGCPDSIWWTIQKRQQRGKPAWTARDIREVVALHKAHPIWEKKRHREPDPPPRAVVCAVETVVYPIDRVSAITRRAIQEGRYLGIHWDPERGGVRTAQVRRML